MNGHCWQSQRLNAWLPAFFKIRFINALQYRAAAWAGMLTQLAWGFMTLLMFAAFYRTNPQGFPMTFPQTVTYIWLQQGLLLLFAIWSMDGEIISSIQSGAIAYEMVRPVDLFNRWATQTAANRLAGTLLRCVPMFVIAFLLPAPYGLTLPAGPVHAAVFLLSTALALGVVVGISMLMYVSLFYTVSPIGVRVLVGMASEFLSGAIIPLPFFPDGVRGAVELLPFAAVSNIPLRIYSGHITGAKMYAGVALQIFWLAALWTLARVLMKRALKKVIVQGG